MKKALSVFLMAAMAFGAFADEPVADVKVAEFSGNAKVEWGVDLDSGKTGFKNTSRVDLKLNLLNNGTKSTTGDGVWGELVLKTDGDSFIQWRNDNYAEGTNAFAANKGMTDALKYKVYVDKAQINFGSAYIGIKTGDTQTGKLKMDAAVRSADSDYAVTIDNVGPAGYSQGIVAGYNHDMFKVDVDFRSFNQAETTYATILAINGNPAAVDPVKEGDIVFLDNGNTLAVGKGSKMIGRTIGQKADDDVEASGQYTDNYAFALEGEFKAVENLSVKAGVSYNFKDDVTNVLGFSASAGYKLALDDTFFVRPQIGFTGSNDTDAKVTTTNMAAGVLFGWGDIGQDKNAGVYFLDGDANKKVSPGVSFIAGFDPSDTKKGTALRIAFYSGEIIPNLTAAADSDIIIADGQDTRVSFAAGAKYAIAVDALTVTPQAGIELKNKAAGDSLKVKAGVDVAGLIDNTTLSAVWASNNLNAESNKMGTLNFGAKIAL